VNHVNVVKFIGSGNKKEELGFDSLQLYELIII